VTFRRRVIPFLLVVARDYDALMFVAVGTVARELPALPPH
jgi:hypothetical protein